MTTLTLAGLLTLLASCSSGRFDTLSATDQGRFNRCWTSIQPVRCPVYESASNLQRHGCEQGARSDYGDELTEEGRLGWLEREGCPPALARQ